MDTEHNLKVKIPYKLSEDFVIGLNILFANSISSLKNDGKKTLYSEKDDLERRNLTIEGRTLSNIIQQILNRKEEFIYGLNLTEGFGDGLDIQNNMSDDDFFDALKGYFIGKGHSDDIALLEEAYEKQKANNIIRETKSQVIDNLSPNSIQRIGEDGAKKIKSSIPNVRHLRVVTEFINLYPKYIDLVISLGDDSYTLINGLGNEGTKKLFGILSYEEIKQLGIDNIIEIGIEFLSKIFEINIEWYSNGEIISSINNITIKNIKKLGIDNIANVRLLHIEDFLNKMGINNLNRLLSTIVSDEKNYIREVIEEFLDKICYLNISVDDILLFNIDSVLNMGLDEVSFYINEIGINNFSTIDLNYLKEFGEKLGKEKFERLGYHKFQRLYKAGISIEEINETGLDDILRIGVDNFCEAFGEKK